MDIIISLGAVLAIIVVALVGAQATGLQYLLGIIIPYAAFAVFLVGFVKRVLDWARSPVPFRIPTTAGQEVSLPWIKSAKLDNPSTTSGVIARMALEIFAFRSLFRNTKAEWRSGFLIQGPAKWLWLGALLFHYGFLVTAVRHLRLFVDPIPAWINGIDMIDGMLQIGAPPVYISDLLLIGGLAILLVRRLALPKVRYISLPADYFPLFLILAIGITGLLMRFFFRVDIVGVKTLVVGLASFRPTLPDGIGAMFFIHVLLVCTLLAYFPFSKLMHMGGVFLSPTRNLANTNRMKRHINPWWKPPKFHPYEEYEDEFRELMKEAGIPVERE
ncbi:MAG TPA: menaquinol oxidoreductase [Thermodesulfobacteriaceae bacterium]|nr:menaquinol oxidoreductase [Thermodesulfobacteriaceae bacterium]